jgi:hypothetical protein
MTLHLIPSIPAPDEPVNNRAKKASKPADMLQCPRCGGREVMETIIGAMIQARKLKGGTRAIVCVGCLMKGERVVLS